MDKKELLAKFLEIENLDQIEESSYDSNLFIVNLHTKKFGDSPEQKLAKVNLVKQALIEAGIAERYTITSEEFIPEMYKEISSAFYERCPELTKIGLHDLVNTLYFLCGGDQSPKHLEFMQEYRDLFDGKEIEDTREESEISDGEYLVLDDSEADQAFEESISNTMDECILDRLPKEYRMYFDTEAYIRDVQINDGRGSTLSSYDGEENEILNPASDEWFYIYRTN